jgi:hypothetical protein
MMSVGEARMSAPDDRAWDFVPAGVAAAAVAVALGYVRLMDAQGDTPRVLFLGGLLAAAALAAYAAVRSLPHRAEAIAVSGMFLFPLGILGLFSIGMPMLVAGVFALAFAAKTREERRKQRVT